MRTTGRVVGHSRSCKCYVRAGCSASLYGGAVTALSSCTQLLAPKLSPRTTVVCRTTGRPPDRHGLFVTRPSSRAGVTAVDCKPCDLVGWPDLNRRPLRPERMITTVTQATTCVQSCLNSLSVSMVVRRCMLPLSLSSSPKHPLVSAMPLGDAVDGHVRYAGDKRGVFVRGQAPCG
jgi:hypothetical protein